MLLFALLNKMSIEILYESDNYLIVNKPFDMYINSDDPNEKNTVSSHIASPDCHLSTSGQQIYFTHRLDYATSGVLCLAKNKKSAAKAGKCFEKREARKYYLAVVRGLVDDCYDIEYDVGDDPVTATTNHKMLAVTSEEVASICIRPRAAHTRLLPLLTGSYCGEAASVVLLKPFTGRRHQLRVHCLAVGHAILGDFTYGSDADKAPHRMFLHAVRLILPIKEDNLDVQTTEPFLSDPKFRDQWKVATEYHKLSTKDEFEKACHVIDNNSKAVNFRRIYFDGIKN